MLSKNFNTKPFKYFSSSFSINLCNFCFITHFLYATISLQLLHLLKDSTLTAPLRTSITRSYYLYMMATFQKELKTIKTRQHVICIICMHFETLQVATCTQIYVLSSLRPFCCIKYLKTAKSVKQQPRWKMF